MTANAHIVAVWGVGGKMHSFRMHPNLTCYQHKTDYYIDRLYESPSNHKEKIYSRCTKDNEKVI